MDTLSPPPGLTLLERARAMRAAGEWPALERLGADMADEALLAEPELAYLYALAARVVGRTARALEVAAQVERAARLRGDRRLRAEAANLVGIAHFEAGRLAEAEERWGELLDTASEWGDEEAASRACNNLGVLANVQGRRDQALLQYERALAAYQRMGNVRGLAETHHNLGISYRDLRFDREADAHFRRAIELAGGASAEDVIAIAETERAMLRARAGDGALAEAMANRALERFTRLGEPLGRAAAASFSATAAMPAPPARRSPSPPGTSPAWAPPPSPKRSPRSCGGWMEARPRARSARGTRRMRGMRRILVREDGHRLRAGCLGG